MVGKVYMLGTALHSHQEVQISMVKACILVCCKLLKTKKVVELAKREPGVKDAFPVHGRWDIAIETEDVNLKEIAEIGVHVYRAEGVEIVETLIEFPKL